MRCLLNARTLAATIAAAGAALIGASVGGMTSIDRELRAATKPVTQSYRVVYETDCPERRRTDWKEF